MNLRSLIPSDQPILWVMLMHAAHESNLEHVKQLPELARYGQDWGKGGDCGYGAFVQDNAVGAAWVRLFPQNEPGYGFVSEDIPELAIAVLPEYRGQGIGTRLLQSLLVEVKKTHPGLSLSVRSGNQAIALYKRLGFKPVDQTEVMNRTGSTSFTMVTYF